ncbi:hypothetical protein DBV39_16155 [Orrella marina]|uniref:Virulence factor MviN n=2 Tax=Orrella marina TaxID=2163011 RepID=A0A2R4XMR3_9BURK|nr:hypothetical protein DBV39_16155 [Orrella marina]
MLWVVFFVLLGSIARAGKEVAIAYRYGVSADVDAYLFVFNMVTWPVGVWFSVLTAVMIPLVARIRENAPDDLPRYRAEIAGFSLMVAVGLTVLAGYGLTYLFSGDLSGLDPQTRSIANDISHLMVLLIPLGLLISLYSAWMLSSGHHANTLMESVPSIVMVGALLIFSVADAMLLVWGTLAGFAFHLISLGLPLWRRSEIDFPRFSFQSSHWAAFWHGFGIMVVGQAIMSLVTIIDQFFAAHQGTGAVATLSYANRVLMLLLGVGAMAVSRATLPVFSRAIASGEKQVKQIAVHWIKLMLLLGVAASIVSWPLANWGISLLFERGAFSAEDTKDVARVFQFGLVQLPFYFAGLVLVSLMTSQRKYHFLFWSSVIGLTTKVFGNAVLSKAFGIEGIALATGLTYAVTFMFFLWALKTQEK